MWQDYVSDIGELVFIVTMHEIKANGHWEAKDPSMYYVLLKLSVLNHVIIIKTKASLPQTSVTSTNVCPLNLLLPKTFILFGFPIFQLSAFLMKVIPETHHVH